MESAPPPIPASRTEAVDQEHLRLLGIFTLIVLQRESVKRSYQP